MIKKTAKQIVSQARTSLILDHPFFGSLALRLEMVEDNRVKTAATDGTHLFYNTNYIKSLTQRQVKGVMAHEVLHVALGHHWRMGERNTRQWNIAGDYAINSNLIAAGFVLPKGVLIDSQYDKMSAEQIYRTLPEQKQQSDPKSGQGKGNQQDGSKSGKGHPSEKAEDPGMCGGVIPAKDEKEAKEQKAKWQAAVGQAKQLAKGSLPGNLSRQIDEVLNPSIPWHVLLRDFVERTARNDYDWTRPSRRYLSSGFVLPSMVSEELPEVVIVVDTSGSIDEKVLAEFSAEASAVLGVYQTTARVVYCDARVHGEQVFTSTDMPMKMEPKGGGGTDFRPAFEYVAKKGYTPACLIYFTDMFGTFPEQEPECPTLWVTKTKNVRAPFGQTVLFEMKG